MFRPAPQRIHHGIGFVLALAALGLCLGPAHAQPGFPPRVPGPINPPGMNPRMPGMNGPVIKTVWRCSGCGHEIGDGAFPPATCPFCGAKIINGVGPSQPGFGGNPGAMNPGGMPPGNNPGVFPPGNMPGAMPPVNNPAAPPVGNNQQFPAVGPPIGIDPPPVDVNVPDHAGPGLAVSPSAGASGARVAAVVLLVLAALLAGLVLLVVGIIVIYNLSGRGREPSRRSRRRQLAEQY
jgi:hypothetical protein